MPRKNKKSQVVIADFFIALFIFFVLVIVVIVSWNNYENRIIEKTEYNAMLGKAYQISNVLVKSGGYPGDWTSENVMVIGLAESDRKLSPSKTGNFIGMPLNRTKKIFQTRGLTFYFALKSLNGSTIEDYGISPSNAKKSVTTRRYVLYNNEESFVEFTLWK